jgi:hypothetical protein
MCSARLIGLSSGLLSTVTAHAGDDLVTQLWHRVDNK